MKRPIVSIIVPTFNRAGMIHRAIESIKYQTFNDWELIVVDDASTDDTEEILQRYMRNDARIGYTKHAENKGGSAARNSGIKKSKGSYIALLDDDDRWHPEKLRLQYDYLQNHPETGLIYSGFCYVDYETDKIIKSVRPRYQGNVSSIILKTNIIGSPTPLIRNECFQRAGLFDEKLTSCQDWDMWIRISRFYSFAYVNECLAEVTMHGRQISSDLSSKIDSRKKLLDKYFYFIKKKPSILSYHYKKLALLHAIDHSPIQTIKYLIRAFLLQPYKVEYILHLILAINPPLHRFFIFRFGSVLRHKKIIFYN
ncbi:MAG: glycosyltransferase family 2 protein [Deltaproteobacteria bacterium]|nr:glycosyltransferase family 2 protein [Deltaproteobacteria bacterium]